MATRAQIQELVDKLVAGYQPEKVILFGSHAYGTPREDSDVDLFVIKDDPRPRWERQVEARMSMGFNGFALDVLVYTPHEFSMANPKFNPLVRDVKGKGVMLYNRNHTQEYA